MNTVSALFHVVIKRDNKLQKSIQKFFLSIASYPRLLLEVFIRSNMGRRYFSMATAITIGILLFAFALLYNQLFPRIPGTFDNVAEYEDWLKHKDDVIRFDFITWYAFIVAFLIFSAKRQREINHDPELFDFTKFTLYSGDKHPFFWQTKWFGKQPSERDACTLYEPGLFFIAGLLLFLIGQKLGMLLMISSLLYSWSYSASIAIAREMIDDEIDKKILSQGVGQFMEEGFFGGQNSGVELFLDRPSSSEACQHMADILQQEYSDPEKTALSF